MDYHVGIDLGTTYSCLAYTDEAGNVRVMRNGEGDETTPSAILFTSETDYSVGKIAKGQALLYPEGYVDFVKRRMGTDYTWDIEGQQWNPQALSSLILKKLINDFEAEQGVELKKAVVTVPAYFGASERQATVEAGKLAGLEEVTIINEPVAASISYGIAKGATKQNVLVYDLGGGTFDVTILSIEDNKFVTRGVGGDKYLGGKDWDEKLTELIINKILENDSVSMDEEELQCDPQIRTNLNLTSEDMKKSLTSMKVVRQAIQAGAHVIPVEISLEEFEECTSGLLNRTIDLMKETLEHSGMTANDIDMLVLVGGSSRMPQVRKAVEAAFPGMNIQLFDPDQAVAKGASIFSSMGLSASQQEELEEAEAKGDQSRAKEIASNKIVIKTSLSKTFGLRVAVDDTGSVMAISNIIYRNATLPAEDTKVYHPLVDGQTGLNLEIYENSTYQADPDSDMTSEEMSVKVGEFNVQFPGPAKRSDDLYVTYRATEEGILYATLRCYGREDTFSLDITSAMTEEEMEEMKDRLSTLVRL